MWSDIIIKNEEATLTFKLIRTSNSQFRDFEGLPVACDCATPGHGAGDV